MYLGLSFKHAPVHIYIYTYIYIYFVAFSRMDPLNFQIGSRA